MEAETDPSLSVAAPAASAPAGGSDAGPAVLPYASADTTRDDAEDHDLAVSSVLCGVIACAPFITGILSLCFGIAVLRRARRLRPLDFVLGVVGVTAGGLNLLFWVGFFLGPLYS